MVNLLREKLSGSSLREVLFSQIEAVVFWIFGGVPGVIGFALRSLIYRLLFKQMQGWCWIQPGVMILHSDRLSVGKHFACNTGSYIGASGGITIGDFVLIGSNVTIASAVHPIDGRFPPIFTRRVEPKRVSIEDDVWIGAGAVILPGVTLRKGSVIGANSVVTADTEEYGVYVGVPARKIRER